MAPWDVVIPFARGLADSIGQSTAATRILRDFQRLMSLIKAVAILRHQHQDRDKQGRLVATVDDYRTVYELVNSIYSESLTGASIGVIEVVTAVSRLHQEDGEKRITYAALERELGVHRELVRRRVGTALGNGWLVNQETRTNHRGRPNPRRTDARKHRPAQPRYILSPCHLCDRWV